MAQGMNRRGVVLAWRAVVEIGFIVFLYYSNLLMGEFERSNGAGKTFADALQDIFTGKNFAIALITAAIGFVLFEALRGRARD